MSQLISKTEYTKQVLKEITFALWASSLLPSPPEGAKNHYNKRPSRHYGANVGTYITRNKTIKDDDIFAASFAKSRS